MQRWYVAIDLKSFYASVECVERHLDPLDTHLVVADQSRTDKTICLAVTPSLKKEGIGGRPRLFEVKQKVKEANAWRRTLARAPLEGASTSARALAENPHLSLDYIVAPPRMNLYMAYSARIYSIYLRHIAPQDIYAYSVDEVFIDVTPYLRTYNKTPEQLTRFLIKEVLKETGITATAGIGTNMYLAKIAMDIIAKKMAPDENGVRLAILDEKTYRRMLWTHEPLTDFWRVGPGTARRLHRLGLKTMGDVALCSVGKDTDYYNENLLYKTFGIQAELLIDHAWGWESVTMEDIKSYKPKNNSLSSGQVLHEPYSAQKARLVLLEMTEAMALKLVREGLVTDQVVVTVGYDVQNLGPSSHYQGEVHIDRYGRAVPKDAHGSANLERPSSSSKRLHDTVATLYDRIIDPTLLVRRLTLALNHVKDEKSVKKSVRQQSLFEDTAAEAVEIDPKERAVQKTILELQERFGKNAVLRASSLEEGATAIERNNQVGGHKA